MPINCYTCEISIRTYGENACLKRMNEETSKYKFNACKSAAEHGHLQCLNMNSKINGVCDVAAENGNIECLRYAFHNGDKFTDDSCILACKSGSISCLRFLHENGCPWDKFVCGTTAEYGNLECLKYAHENGCPWDYEVCENAAKYGNLECLKYAHENGCSWDIEIMEEACLSNNLEIIKYVHEIMKEPFDELSCIYILLKYGYLECLKYVHKNGGKLTTNTMQFALEKNNGECIKYLIQMKCPMDEYANIMAVKFCDLDIVRYLYENNLIKLNDSYLLKHSILNKMNVLRYILDNGCPYSSDIINDIIKLDKVSYLKYFRNKYQMGIDESNLIYIIKQDAIRCLKYVYKKTLLFDIYSCFNIYLKSRNKCRKFLRQILYKKIKYNV